MPLQSTTNKWERQNSNLRRKTSTDLQYVAFDRSALLYIYIFFFFLGSGYNKERKKHEFQCSGEETGKNKFLIYWEMEQKLG